MSATMQDYWRWRVRVIRYLGSKCVTCGSVVGLEIHHKNPKKKKFNIAHMWSYAWATVVKELDKCELRCECHHRAAHIARHGTIARYRHHRCRCLPCRTVWNAATKRWKQ